MPRRSSQDAADHDRVAVVTRDVVLTWEWSLLSLSQGDEVRGDLAVMLVSTDAAEWA